MPWLLVLHISALLFWCASLLYLPALIALNQSHRIDINQLSPIAQSRILFTLVLTPAALLAVVSGTAMFIIDQLFSLWLILKLTLVSGLVVCHGLNGWLIMRIEKGTLNNTAVPCLLLGLASAILMVTIITVVLMKPF